MNAIDALWRKLKRSKKYREEFVAAHVKRAIPLQARALMKAKKINQQQLAERAGLSQGVISRAIDPEYGNLTLNTIIRLAAGFDLAFIGRFVPFSELVRWYGDLPKESFAMPSFGEDSPDMNREEQIASSDALLRMASGGSRRTEQDAPPPKAAFQFLTMKGLGSQSIRSLHG